MNVVQSQNPRALEFLLQAIATARSTDELNRLHVLARAHYTGRVLSDVEVGIAGRRMALHAAKPNAVDSR